MGQNIAVTGGTGFVGANLVRRLLADGHRVHLLNRAHANFWRISAIKKDLHLHVVDLGDRENTEAVLCKIRPSLIFHLAAYGAYSDQNDIDQILATNYFATVQLIQAAKAAGVERIVNTGSSSEYGLKPHPSRETDPPEPNSDYAAAKAAATLYCQSYARRQGLTIPTLRLYSAYGPWEDPRRLIPQLILHSRQGQLPPLVAADIARDFVYIDDVIEAYLQAAAIRHDDPGMIYNIGTGRQTSLKELVELARSLFAVTAEPRFGTMANRHWDTSVWCANPDRAKNHLNWQARTPLEEGLSRFSLWLDAHSNYSKTKNLNK